MQLYRGSERQLSRDVASGNLGARLVERFRERLLHSPGAAEIRSWERNLPFLADERAAADLAGVEVLLEYALPLSSRRVDALLVGTHPQGGISAIVWENKQWTAGEIEDVEER